MPLSHEAKLLIKDEVDLLTKEQQETRSGLKEADLELKAQVAESLASHQKLVQELEYKQKELNWHLKGLRTLWIILIGGGVVGIWYVLSNFQNYLDTRIGLRLANSDRLTLAYSMAYTRNWRGALLEFDDAFND